MQCSELGENTLGFGRQVMRGKINHEKFLLESHVSRSQGTASGLHGNGKGVKS